MFRFQTFITAGLLSAMIFATGCEEKQAKTKKAPATEEPGDPADPRTVSSSEVNEEIPCEHLLTKVSGGLLTLVTKLCKQLDSLRQDSNSYWGQPEISFDDIPLFQGTISEQGNVSSIEYFSSSRTAATAEQYFKHMRLQISDPDDFRNRGYQYDEQIRYNVESESSETVDFDFLREPSDPEEVEVHYTARSKFFELSGGKGYGVVTESKRGITTVRSLLSATIILPHNGSDLQSQVVTVVYQVYENSGNHNSAVAKLNRQMKEAVKRGIANGEIASSDPQL